jgi:hypothetical protein
MLYREDKAMTIILELPDSKEVALKAKAQAQGVSAEQYVRRILDRDLEQQTEPSADAGQQPIWEVITNMMKDVPDEVFDRLPKDSANQVDHYIYGLPKRD